MNICVLCIYLILYNQKFYPYRMACAFCYYGVVLMTTELFEASATRCSGDGGLSTQLKPVETCSADCKELTTTDYIDLLWTTLAEFPGNICQ